MLFDRADRMRWTDYKPDHEPRERRMDPRRRLCNSRICRNWFVSLSSSSRPRSTTNLMTAPLQRTKLKSVSSTGNCTTRSSWIRLKHGEPSSCISLHSQTRKFASYPSLSPLLTPLCYLSHSITTLWCCKNSSIFAF